MLHRMGTDRMASADRASGNLLALTHLRACASETIVSGNANIFWDDPLHELTGT